MARKRSAVLGERVSIPIAIIGKVASMQTFALPPAIAQLVLARNAVRDHYRRILTREGSDVDLAFTLDGNLIGDIGEAIAVELFGVKLVAARSNEGVDGHAPDGRSVQVKVTGTRRGPAFRCIETKADHLLFWISTWKRRQAQSCSMGPNIWSQDTSPKFSPISGWSPGDRSLMPIVSSRPLIGCQSFSGQLPENRATFKLRA